MMQALQGLGKFTIYALGVKKVPSKPRFSKHQTVLASINAELLPEMLE